MAGATRNAAVAVFGRYVSPVAKVINEGVSWFV